MEHVCDGLYFNIQAITRPADCKSACSNTKTCYEADDSRISYKGTIGI